MFCLGKRCHHKLLTHAPPPPLQDPILSFSHTFSLKSAHVGGQNPPKWVHAPLRKILDPALLPYNFYVQLQEDPSHVSMEWILQHVQQYIERDNDKDATYIVDYLPNLKYLLRIPDITKDCKSSMNKFEERVS